jgi:hypothetical protein
MNKQVLTQNLFEPLGLVTTANVSIDPGDGNLVVDGAINNEQLLASGTLQYLEKSGLPTWSVNTGDDATNFRIQAAGKVQPWFRLPWSACNGATEWHIHLNHRIPSEISAHSDGGNIRLDLTGMPVMHVSADTGGGNVEVTLPDPKARISLTAKSGAGNVVVRLLAGTQARILATTGLGKLILSPRFSKLDTNLYQSSEYDDAERRVELTLSSGAGNVVVEEYTAQ